MKLPEYQIWHDREGWYVVCEGYELRPTHRHNSWRAAEEERKRWEAEDAEEAARERAGASQRD